MVLLVGGHMGSGKSVLRRVVHAHPEVTLLDDFAAFVDIDKHWVHYLDGLRLQGNYGSHRHPLTMGFNVSFLTRLLWQTKRTQRVRLDDVATVLHEIFPETPIVGDVHSRYAEVVIRHGAHARVKLIVVYRDCRDIAAVIPLRRRRRHAGGDTRVQWIDQFDTAGKLAGVWLSFVEQMENAPGDVFTVRYEDLVHEPRAVLARLGEWLGVETP